MAANGNVGSLSAGLSLDFSVFQNGMQKATELTRSNSTLMSAAMKQTSREGAESFRLIDEALGIRVSRPLTRILTQEFPAFASGLQAILGASVFGAVAAIGVEAFDKVAKKIEEAGKAQEKFADSSRHADEVVTTVIGGLQNKLAELTGDHRLKFSIQGAEEAKRAISEMGKAWDEAQKDAEKASSGWNKFLAGIGDLAGDIGRGAAKMADMFGGNQIAEAFGTKNLKDRFFDPQQVAAMKDALKDMRVDLEIALNTDEAKGTHQALGLIQNDVKAATAYLKDMEKAGDASGAALARASLQFFTNSQTAANLSQQIAGVEAQKAADEDALKAAEKLNALHKEIGESLTKLQPETDPLKKLDSEIAEFRSKASNDFKALGETAASALQLSSARAALDAYGKKLDELKIKLEGDILAKQALELFSKPLPGREFTGTTPPPGSGFTSPQAIPPVIPTLGEGGTAAAQFDAFSKDVLAQNKLVAAAFQSAITPTEEYQLKIDELKLAFSNLPDPLKNSVQAQEAFNAELAKLGAAETAAELHLEELQKKLDELLSHSTSASDGIKAFFLQLDIESSRNGKFAFDILNQGLKGFEDELTKAVFTGKAKWEDMFRSLTESAFKFMLNKDIAGFFNLISGTGVGKTLGLDKLTGLFGAQPTQQQGPAPALPPTVPGSLTGLGALTGGPGQASFQTATTTFATSTPIFQTAVTGLSSTMPVFATAATTFSAGAPILSTAASELLAAATKMSLSGTGGLGDIGDLSDSGAASLPDIPGFASGTDDAPGGMAWVGEQGPELLNLPTGSSVTPASSLRNGDHNHYWHIDARGNEDVGERIVRAITLATPAIQARTMAAVQEVQKRTPQGR
jgi:hypothetical protein